LNGYVIREINDAGDDDYQKYKRIFDLFEFTKRPNGNRPRLSGRQNSNTISNECSNPNANRPTNPNGNRPATGGQISNTISNECLSAFRSKVCNKDLIKF
jgi:hypothetical protein